MIIKTIETANELRNEFITYDRDYYTFEAYEAMIQYLEEIGENYELDVIALCCDFNEDTIEEIRSNYGLDNEDDVLEYLNYNTYAIETDEDKILYIAF